MASSAQKQDFVTNSRNACATLLNMYEALKELDTLWAGTSDYDTLVDQAFLDSVASFGGLTTTQLADAEFALSTIKGQIESSYVALLILKNVK